MHVNLEEVTSFTKTYTSWTGDEEMLTKVSNTNLDVQHESWTRWNIDDELNNNHRDFHEDGIPQVCEQGYSIGQTQKI